VQNRKLLLVALVLGAVVVILFNIQVRSARKSGEGETIELAGFDRRMTRGEKIKTGDLKLILFPERFRGGLPNVLEWENRSLALGKRLIRPVQENEFVRFDHIEVDESSLPSNNITPGMTAYVVPMDRRRAPGNILVPNSHVNLVGMFTINGKTEARVILQEVRVLGVGGVGPAESMGLAPSRSRGNLPRRSYDSIVIEVSPKVALQLDNLRTHALGDFWVQVLNTTQISSEPSPISPALESLYREARGGGVER